ncbi:MAG: murein biosynthesis integral membrane protein MurJ [Lachnospirales bacterium]
MSKKKSIVNVIVLVMFLNIFVKIFSFTRDFLLGRVIGVSIEMDAYLMSLSITTKFFVAFGSALVTAIIPLIVKEESENAKREKFVDIFNFLFIMGTIISIIYMVFTPQIIGMYVSGFSAEKMALTITLTRIMIPSIYAILYAYFFVAIMQSNSRYLLAACISLPYNALIIFYIVTSAKANFNVYALSLVTLVGWFGQAFLLIPSVIRMKPFKIKARSIWNDNTKLFVKGFFITSIVVATIQATNITNNKFLSYYGDGVVTTYFYGNMIYNTITTMVVYAITVVMFPKFNESYVKNRDEFYFYIKRVLQVIVIILLPICIGLILVGDVMMMILFLSENYDYESVMQTSNFLKIFALNCVSFGFIDVLNKGYYATGKRVIPLKTTAIIVGLNVVFNVIFILIYGTSGNFYLVVLSTVVSYVIGVLYSLISFDFTNKRDALKNILTTFIKCLFAGVFMYIVVAFVQNIAFGSLVEMPVLNKFIYLFSSIIIGIISYFSFLIIVKEKIVSESFFSMVKKLKK